MACPLVQPYDPLFGVAHTTNLAHTGSLFKRLAQPIKLRNDNLAKTPNLCPAAIRKATTWYQAHLAGKPPNVLLLTNDAENARRAREDGATAQTVYAYVQTRTDKPELLDFVARTGDTGGEEAGPSGEGETGPQAKKRMLYSEVRRLAPGFLVLLQMLGKEARLVAYFDCGFVLCDLRLPFLTETAARVPV